MTDIRRFEFLRDEALQAVKTLSDMQFRLGYLALVAKDYYPVDFVDYRTFAADLNISSKSLNEYANVVDFYRQKDDDPLPDDLIHQIEDLHELRKTNIVTYTHFRAAKRIGMMDKTLSRLAQVEIAVAWLEARLDDGDKVDAIEARAAAESGGESFEKMSIVWDSRKSTVTSPVEVLRFIDTEIRFLIQEGKQWRVVVYQENGDG